MLTKILGIIWIVSGLFWALKPDMLKNRLTRKMGRKMRWVVYGFIIVFGFLIIGSAVKAPGILPKIVGLAAMLATVKIIILITSRTTEKITEWWSAKPVIFFRIWGLLLLTMGIMLMFAK